MDDKPIPIAYDISKPDPEFDPEMVRQAAEEAEPEEEYVPSADKADAGRPRLDGRPEFPDYLDPDGVGSTGAPEAE